MDLGERCQALIAELGVASPDEIVEIRPLTGGVASDIAMVDLGDRRICAKFALPKLKVAADWRAPVHRNAAEYAWLQVVAENFPDSAVQLFGRSNRHHGFAMEFVEGDTVYLWKDRLLAEASDQGESAKVGDLIGKIHAVSAQQGFDRTAFQNQDDFLALRIEPYLSHTAKAHPNLGTVIGPLERMLYDGRRVLVHGDASPKNILFRDGSPIMLDAECATMGDASFDISFCLNHLVIKAIHLPATRARLLLNAGALWDAYAAHVMWEDTSTLEARVCALLAALMLARVDGKSPVEYLNEDERQCVRDIAIPLILQPVTRLDSLLDRVSDALNKSDR